MLTFLFWNLRRRFLADHLVALAKQHDIDFLILAECEMPGSLVLEKLHSRGLTYYEATGLPESLAVFTRFEGSSLRPQHDSARLRVSVRRFVHAEHPEMLIAIAHLPSQLYSTPASADMECVTLSRIIHEQEANAGHRRTVLVGDLNLNPFNHGVVGSQGLHAVMTKDIALRESRTVKGIPYPLFYNPMWSHFGDSSSGPPGTYFYERNEAVMYFWNMFDQVLLRPELARFFDPGELKILTEAGPTSLVGANGRPNVRVGSDHFPLLFKLQI